SGAGLGSLRKRDLVHSVENPSLEQPVRHYSVGTAAPGVGGSRKPGFERHFPRWARAIRSRESPPGNRGALPRTYERDGPLVAGLVAATYISPDGKWLYFGEQGDSAGAKYSAYMRATDGSPAIRLGDGRPWAVSPDGKWVASLVPGEPQQLMLLPTRSGEAVNLSQAGFNYQNVEWVPDGKRLVVVGNEPGKAPREYLANAAGGPLKAVTPENQAGLISPDGKSVVVAIGDKLTFYPVDGGQPREAKNTLPPDLLFMTPRLVAHYVYGAERQEVPLKVFRFDLTTGQKQLWKELAPAERAGVYNIGLLSVTPDARWYALSYVRGPSGLYKVEGLE